MWGGRFGGGNFAAWLGVGRGYILPGFSAVARDENQSIVGARPNRVRFLERRSNRVNDAAVLSFFRIACRENSKVRGRLQCFGRQVWTDNLPTVYGIRGFEEHVSRKVERVRFERRKNHWQRARIAILAAANRLRRNLRVFANVLLRAREPVAIKNVWIERVDGDIVVFENSDEMPIAKSSFAIIAAAQCCRGAAFLLGAVNPIWKTIVGRDVIELRRWLVIPTAPRLAAVHADDRALIGAQRD